MLNASYTTISTTSLTDAPVAPFTVNCVCGSFEHTVLIDIDILTSEYVSVLEASEPEKEVCPAVAWYKVCSTPWLADLPM